MNWKIALSTGIFLNKPLLGVLADIKESGFKLVEVSAHPVHFGYKNMDTVKKIRAEMDRLGLCTISMHAPYSELIDITMLRESDRKRSVAEVEAAIDALTVLGGSKLVIHAGSIVDEANEEIPERLSQSLRSLTEIYDYCLQSKIKLVIENMLGHLVGGRIEELQWILARLPQENIGVCIDSGHGFLGGNLMKSIKLFAPYLALVHAHDNNGTYDDHLPPGEGKIDWPQFLDALYGAGFGGEIVIEVQGNKKGRSLLKRARQSACFLKDCSRGKAYSVIIDNCGKGS
jgi:sugar phosphate isomerase/epimerase